MNEYETDYLDKIISEINTEIKDPCNWKQKHEETVLRIEGSGIYGRYE